MLKAIRVIREQFSKVRERGFSFSLNSRLEENMGLVRRVRGDIFWEMRDGATGQLQSSGTLKNVVTLDASVLIARLLKTATSVAHQSEPNYGIYALGVGTGDVSWNANNPPPGTQSQRSLHNEIARKQIASSSYIDANGSVSSVPTNVIDFTTIYSESEAVGGLTEMGLIGGDISSNMSIQNPALPANGTYDASLDLVGLDTLVNYVTFPVINKPATSTLSWTWRLTI